MAAGAMALLPPVTLWTRLSSLICYKKIGGKQALRHSVGNKAASLGALPERVSV